MVLAKGGCEGGSDNRHKGADQWLVVISGTGTAVINGRKVRSARDRWSSSNAAIRTRSGTPAEPAETVSVYCPASYTSEGDELPAGKK